MSKTSHRQMVLDNLKNQISYHENAISKLKTAIEVIQEVVFEEDMKNSQTVKPVDAVRMVFNERPGNGGLRN